MTNVLYCKLLAWVLYSMVQPVIRASVFICIHLPIIASLLLLSVIVSKSLMAYQIFIFLITDSVVILSLSAYGSWLSYTLFESLNFLS